MSQNDIAGLACGGGVCLLLLIIGIVLLRGKGAFLIAGYNTMRREEREKYDEKALCRFVGWLLIAFDLGLALVLVMAVLRITWLTVCVSVLIPVLIIGAVIHANTGNRFRK